MKKNGYKILQDAAFKRSLRLFDIEDIEINDPTDDVTAGMPNATSTDEDDVTTNNTWATWILSNHNIMERDSRYFVGTNANSGNELELSLLAPVFDNLLTATDLPAADEVDS